MMIPYERQEKILKLIQEKELMYTEEIQQKVSEISLSTLRRDLVELEKRGEIKRLSGGAVKPILAENELSIDTKAIRNTKEKEIIAKLAAAEILEGETIYLDSGSSSTILFNELVHRDIHIVTSNTELVKYLGNAEAEITFLGGSYNANLSSVAGPLAIDNLKNFIFDRSFIGTNGVDPSYGVTTPSLVETEKKREVIKRSKKAYVLADSSKFGVVSAVKIVELGEISIIAEKNNLAISDMTELIHP